MVCIMNDLERIKLLKEKIYKFKEISKLSNSDLSYLIGFGANRNQPNSPNGYVKAVGGDDPSAG